MIIFYTNIVISLLMFPVLLANDKYLKRISAEILFFYFLLIIFFQSGSPDFFSYQQIYAGLYKRKIEFLYTSVCLFLSNVLNIGFKAFWIIQGIVMVVLLRKLVFAFSENILLSLILFMNIYLPLKMLTQVRNFIAVELFFIACLMYMNNKKIYLPIFIISVNTHISTGLGIVSFFRRQNILLFLTFCSIFFLFMPISKILPIDFISTIIPESFRYYLEWLTKYNTMGKTLFHISRFIILLIFSIVFLNRFESRNSIIFSMFMIAFIVKFAFSQFGEMALRLSDTFMISEIFLFSNISFRFKNNSKYFFYFMVISYSIIMLFLTKKNFPNLFPSFFSS